MDYVIKIYKDWKLHSEFTEIVPDMDDDYMFNEKQSIRESARSLKKYGSTCNHVRNNEVFIRHEVEKTDTLQGIALKYGCTTEQIRRANRLFASDSLFLRQYLLIPVDKTSPFYPKDDRPQTLSNWAINTSVTTTTTTNTAGAGATSATTTTTRTTVESRNQNNCPNSKQQQMTNNSTTSLDSVTLSPDEENKKYIDEFLGKIDSTIAESKKYVAKSEHKARELVTSQSDDDLFTTGDMYKRRVHSATTSSSSSSSHQHHHTRHSSSGSTTDTAQLLNITQGKRIQNSLQRLEKQQDEFFEL